jgi:DNA-binding XRE family transcriptional regulator
LANLSKSELARRIGVSRPTIIAWETQPVPRANPLWHHIAAVAAACAVDPAWLLTGRGRPRGSIGAANNPFSEKQLQLLYKLTQLPRTVRSLIEKEIDVLSSHGLAEVKPPPRKRAESREPSRRRA